MTQHHVSPSGDPQAAFLAKYPQHLVRRIIDEVRPYTMVPDPGLEQTIRLAMAVVESGIPGDFVECGTWMGGCSFAMLLAQQYAFGKIHRPIWMYDSFQGMSPPSEPDGSQSKVWWARAQSGGEDPDHQNFCKAPLTEVRRNIKKLKLGDYIKVHPGWLNETLPKAKPEKIGLLRVDVDWYDPVTCALDELVPNVSDGAPIILDDYYAWRGCSVATHEYLAKHKLWWRIRTIPGLNGAWMLKEKKA